MSIEHTASASGIWLKPSYRTLSEQAVGLAIFMALSFALFLFNQWMISFSVSSGWYNALNQAPWVIQGWPETPLWIGYHVLMPLSIWTLWRRFSFFTLKLELSIFLTQLLFQALWSLSFFFFQETLLALSALLLLCFNTLLCILLFRKREKAARILLIPSFIWVFYLMGINMTICVFNP